MNKIIAVFAGIVSAFGIAIAQPTPIIPGNLAAQIPNAQQQTTSIISTGAATPSSATVALAAESGTADDLDTLVISNFQAGDTIKLIADTGDTITLKDGTGNITTPGNSDLAITDSGYIFADVTATGVIIRTSGGGVLLANDGAVTAPSISFAGQNNTGWYNASPTSAYDYDLRLAQNGEDVFRVVRRVDNGGTPNAAFSFGSPQGFETAFPTFMYTTGTERPKTYAESVIMKSVDDTVELACGGAEGTSTGDETGTADQTTQGWFDCLIYAWGYDQNGDQLGASNVSSQEGTGPYYGRSAQIHYRFTEDLTNISKPGAIVFLTTPPNQIALRERAWISDSGRLVAGGQASYEFGGTTYPETPSDNFNDPIDGIARGIGTRLSGVFGPHDSLNTGGWGALNAIAVDTADDKAISITKAGTGQDGTSNRVGFDQSIIHASDRLLFECVDAGTSTACGDIALSAGQWRIGAYGDDASLQVDPLASADYSVNIVGGIAGTTNALIRPLGDGANLDLDVISKGTGSVFVNDLEFFSAGGVGVDDEVKMGAGALSLDDDIAGSIALPSGSYGIVEVMTSNRTWAFTASYDLAGTTAIDILSAASNSANITATTGTLSNGGGTDGEVTVSVHSDDNLYISNRAGGTINFNILVKSAL